MSRTLHCKVCVMLFPVATGIGIAQPHQMLYDQDGHKLAVGVEAGLRGFARWAMSIPEPSTSTRMHRFGGRSRPRSDAPRAIGSKALPSRSSNWKRRFFFRPHLCARQRRRRAHSREWRRDFEPSAARGAVNHLQFPWRDVVRTVGRPTIFRPRRLLSDRHWRGKRLWPRRVLSPAPRVLRRRGGPKARPGAGACQAVPSRKPG
jgi:hypothetical protein